MVCWCCSIMWVTHYTLRGSGSTHGAYCGVFSVSVHVAVDIARWDVGTAL